MSDVLSVQNKQGKLRAGPSFLSKVSYKLPYGTKVTKIEQNATWVKVQAGNLIGWLHKDALTDKEIILKAGSENVKTAASEDELVLAGKGFNKNVEKSFKQKNPGYNYASVDKMESFSVSEKSLAVFAKEGGLNHG